MSHDRSPPAESKRLLSESVHVEDERGATILTRLAPGVLLYECSGFLAASFTQPTLAMARSEMERTGSVALLTDAWELRSIDTGFREAWTAWMREHPGRFHMRLLLQSRLMEMAASLANLFAGSRVIHTYSDLNAWERACTADLPSFQCRRKVAD